ncbi:MAG: phenylalanine--tRNA ligase subunit beta [Armatimonadetes bacterium]|nr:phenylalanine--tRNA ligase subunit beta [Armatimonadota bacterium]
MKLTESMLRDFVKSPLDAPELADLLTMTGFELEEIFESEGESVLDINIMANRGDGASVLGLSREILAKDPHAEPTELYQRAASRFPAADSGSRDIWAMASAEIQTSSCTRFACRVFEDLQNGESPEWLKKRLRQIGQRPISLLVDLTNYVMFEVGQPLHAYDLDQLVGGRIIVRQAEEGETLKTLDGVVHRLKPHHMVIADTQKAIGLAGVMGGEETEVTGTTTRCLLEAAHFSNTSVRRTRKELGIATEASYRFERSVDPEGVVVALNRFAELYAEITGGKPVGGVIDVYPERTERESLTVFLKRASGLLGMAISADDAERYLKGLGFEILGVSPDSLEVVPPSWRTDILREEDLVEELGRVHGYEKIPEALPIGSTPLGGPHGFEALTDKIREAVLMAGFDQTISHSLRDLHPLDFPADSGSGENTRVRVRQPHSPEMAFLRNSILPSLADAQRRNNVEDLHIFEIGRVHGTGVESTQLGLMSAGRFDGPGWRPSDSSTADFFTLKGVVESVAQAVSLATQFRRTTTDPRFHPTRQTRVVMAGAELGVMGQIHPLVAEACGLPPGTVLAELTLDPLASVAAGIPDYRPISRNPASRRDIAILIKKDVPYSEISDAVARSGGPDLERFWLFDVYEGQGVPEGLHSLALALQFRRMNANLTDDESNALRDQVVSALQALGATLR